jgi:hypothetical protein
VSAQDVASQHDLDGVIVGINVVNQKPDGQGRKLRCWTAGAGGRLMDAGFGEIHWEFHELRVFFLYYMVF